MSVGAARGAVALVLKLPERDKGEDEYVNGFRGGNVGQGISGLGREKGAP